MKKLTNYKKFLFGFMIVGILVVAGSVVSVGTANQAYADCIIASTLRVGSSGFEVQCLQGIVGVSIEGKFGPITEAAVKEWQASHSLVADGIVGPMTRAVLNAQGQISGSFPAGCSSAIGYSPLTGVKCDDTGSGLPAGCQPGFMYSPLTGIKCDGSQGGSSPTSPLTGGAGSISVNKTSSYSNEEVGESGRDVGVLSFDVEAEGSDIAVSSVRVEFHQGTPADEEDMTDYIRSVYIFMGSEMVGESDMDDFSENNDIFTRNIALTDAIVKKGKMQEFSVRVDAQNNLDSGDIDTAVVNVGISSIRYKDGDGVTSTDSFTLDIDDDAADEELEESFTFGTFASSANIELKITNGKDDEEVNDAHVIDIHSTDKTTNVPILSFNIEVEGDSDIAVDSLPVRLTVGGAQDNVDEMISGISLWMDGDKVGTVKMTSGCVEDGAGCAQVGTMETYVFQNLDLSLDASDDYEFLVKVDIFGLNGAGDVAEGDTIWAEFGEIQTDLSQFDVEDESGEDLVDGDVTGTVSGEASEVRDSGIKVVFISATAEKTAGDAGANQSDSGSFVITFDVTAFGDDVYIDHTAPTATGGITESDINPTPDAGLGGTLSTTITSPSGANDGAEGFRVRENRTERFAITVDVRDGVVDLIDGFYDISLGSILYALTDINGDIVYNFNLREFKTPQVFLDDNE